MVLTEDAYNRLKQARSQGESLDASVQTDPEIPSSPVSVPQMENKEVSTSTDEYNNRLNPIRSRSHSLDTSAQRLIEIPSNPIDIPQIDNEEVSTSKGFNEILDPLENIHKRFRKTSLELLNKLEQIPQFSWNRSTGQVYIDGHNQGIDIENLLKAVCVPFTTTKVPPDCIRLIKSTGLKPRNHLLHKPPLPKWHNYFNI